MYGRLGSQFNSQELVLRFMNDGPRIPAQNLDGDRKVLVARLRGDVLPVNYDLRIDVPGLVRCQNRHPCGGHPRGRAIVGFVVTVEIDV